MEENYEFTQEEWNKLRVLEQSEDPELLSNHYVRMHDSRTNNPVFFMPVPDKHIVDMIMADTSYSDMRAADNRGKAIATVTLRADGTTTVDGELHDGEKIVYTLAQDQMGEGDRLVGRLNVKFAEESDNNDYFVKARLHDGSYLLCHNKGFLYKYKIVRMDEMEKLVGTDLRVSLCEPSVEPSGLDQYSTSGEEAAVGNAENFEMSRIRLIDDIFRVVDRNMDGKVDRNELRRHETLIKLVAAPECDIRTFDELFAAIDVDASEEISLDELRCFLLKHGKRAFTRSFDHGMMKRGVRP